ESPEKLVVRMWLFPYLTWATIGMIVFVLGYMFIDEANRQVASLSMLVAVAVVAVGVVLDRRRKALDRAWTSTPEYAPE
ncbi:amino acid transporter, partial [Streptomyces sp. NPDC055607]